MLLPFTDRVLYMAASHSTECDCEYLCVCVCVCLCKENAALQTYTKDALTSNKLKFYLLENNGQICHPCVLCVCSLNVNFEIHNIVATAAGYKQQKRCTYTTNVQLHLLSVAMTKISAQVWAPFLFLLLNFYGIFFSLSQYNLFIHMLIKVSYSFCQSGLCYSFSHNATPTYSVKGKLMFSASCGERPFSR